MDGEDEIVHQFPLLTRPLQTPPSAAASGKRITARIKPQSRVLEIHVPADTRPEVWNKERGHTFGEGQVEDDREKNQDRKGKGREGDEPRLSEIRMRSEEIPQQGAHMLGIVRDGELHLHPIDATHQFRPTLTYLDVLSRKSKRRGGIDSDSDSDDGPPPDPDEAPPAAAPKKAKKSTAGDAKEVQVSARRTDDKTGANLSGLSNARRDMLAIIHAEQDESWQNLQFSDMEATDSEEAMGNFFSHNAEELNCITDVTTFLKDTKSK